MTLLHDAVEAKKFDIRTVERNMTRGVVSADEVEKAVKKLPDDTEAGDWVSIDSLMKDDEGSH